jgi:hypothetical protein
MIIHGTVKIYIFHNTAGAARTFSNVLTSRHIEFSSECV